MSKSAFSLLGLAHKLFLSAEAQGYTPKLINELAEHPDLFRQLLLLQLGYAELVPIKHLPDPSPIVLLDAPPTSAISSDIYQQPEVPSLIVPVDTIDVSATEFRFVARDHFILNIGEDALVKISSLGENFATLFLGKVEQPFGGSTLCYGELSRLSQHDSVIVELGGEEKARTNLVECFSCMLTHAHESKKNNIAPDRRSHVFYIPDTNGTLRLVDFRWYDDGGYHIYAYPIGITDEWPEGTMIYSRLTP